MKQNQYEITYLIDPTLSEEDRGALESSVDDLVVKLSGSVVSSSPTLRKKLAYEIARKSTAFLRVINIELPTDKIAEAKDFLKRSAGVMRFTILATPERTRMSQELLEKHAKKSGRDKGGKPMHKKAPEAASAAVPAKEVTMQDVEKGIEEALTEEVK